MTAPLNVLFLCTGNTARSIIAESTLNTFAHGRYRAFSAGSQPAGRINPFVREFLEAKGMSLEGARSKSWEEFAGAGAPRMDIVITVCDSAAAETCPVWPGAPITAHWGVADPGAGKDEAEVRSLIVTAFDVLHGRIRKLLDLPAEQLDRSALQAKIREIGREG
jgi:arsenate reductase (thioredoxin)